MVEHDLATVRVATKTTYTPAIDLERVRDAWIAELDSIKAHFDKFEDKLPQGLLDELGSLRKRLSAMPSRV